MNIIGQSDLSKRHHLSKKNQRLHGELANQDPFQLLPKPEQIEVTAPVPDYPPMNFRYKGKLHKIIKADGPKGLNRNGGYSKVSTGIIIM
jgi:hypothetical protein